MIGVGSYYLISSRRPVGVKTQRLALELVSFLDCRSGYGIGDWLAFKK
jgi:hypothetical protein